MADKQMEVCEPPVNTVLEQEILCTLLKNDKLMSEVKDSIDPRMFSQKQHRDIFKAMLYSHFHNVPITYETIIERLKSEGIKDEEELMYVIQVGGVLVAGMTFEQRIELFIDIYRKRELYELYLKRVTKPLTGIASNNLVKEVEGIIEGMGVTSNVVIDKFEEYVDTWLEDMEDDTPIETYKLGFRGIDDILLLENGNLMIIGARPSVGKSAFATNIVKNFCLQGKKPLFVSLEMTKKEYMNRLVSNMAKVEARKLKRKELKTNEEWERIRLAKEKIKKFKFNFYDKGGMKIEQLVGLCKYLKKRGELDILVIDYLQLLESNQYKGQKQNQVGYISQKLKQIAMELEIPVIALSQLSRGLIEKGVPREPQLSDLRDSGSLEQDANTVLMLHTDDVEQKYKNERFIKLFIRKNRDGRLGRIDFSYYGDFVDFVEKEWVNGVALPVKQEDLTYIPEEEMPF